MISREEALTLDRFHVARPGQKCQVWRRNGKSQTWVRHPDRFRTPVKWGLSQYGQLTDRGLSVRGRPVMTGEVHTEAGCPDLAVPGETRMLPRVPADPDRADPVVFGC